ncbi:MAG: UDP-N-acetylmuramoyl-tripeptide--D-alanyl-D-alanine ligase [Polyangiales bacterium]
MFRPLAARAGSTTKPEGAAETMATAIPTNEVEFTLGVLADVCGGTLVGADAAAVTRGVSTDTRTIAKDSLFVALRGERVDGHDFVDGALEKGALCAVVAKNTGPFRGPHIVVDDTLVALGIIARTALRRARTARLLPVLAVGGAAGKTTTKELAAASVSALWGSTLATKGNLNNLIGAPMTLLSLLDEHRAVVAEVGTNAHGEIARLGAIVEPDVALVLNVDNEHTEGLESLEAVAREEGALFAAIRDVAGSAAVGNLEEPYSFGQIDRRPKSTRKLCFGEGEGADVRLVSRKPTVEGRSKLSLRVAGTLTQSRAPFDCEISLGLLGPGPAIDAAAALCATLALLGRGASEGEIVRAAKAMESVKPVSGRLVPFALASGALVIDDTYNANPRSVRASSDAAFELAALRGGRVHVLLGDMLELGALGPSLHAEVVAHVEQGAPKSFVGVGPLMRAALGARWSAANTPEDAADLVRSSVAPADVVLVKGSRGIRMERAVVALCANASTVA